MKLKECALIVTAGGSGLRMGKDVKKQYLNIDRKPILFHTLNNLLKYNFLEAILVVPKDDLDFVDVNILKRYNFSSVKLCSGGETRHHSVFNGLCEIEKSKYVFIHDGVRPFVTRDLITKLYDNIKKNKYCGIIPVQKLTDTIKKVNDRNEVINTINREVFRSVQTPQVFEFEKLINCYKKSKNILNKFTDDSSIMEYYGYDIFTVEGNPFNIKITLEQDIKYAEYIIDFLKKSN